MSDKYHEFWIEQFNGHGGLKAYYSEPERMNVKLHINDRPEVPAYNYYHLVEYAALESANAENEQLKSKIGKQLSEILQQDNDYAKIHKTNVAYEFKIEKLESENKKLADENAELKWFVCEINKYVLPGHLDTQDSALKVFNDLKSENAKLRAALAKIADSWPHLTDDVANSKTLKELVVLSREALQTDDTRKAEK